MEDENEILQIGEDEIKSGVQNSNAIGEKGKVADLPSTSKNTRDKAEQLQSLTGQSEEQLLANPVLQRMMQKFFDAQMKNMGSQEANTGTHSKLDNKAVHGKTQQVNQELIKSPSDSTLYVQALKKKQPTPQNDSALNWNNDVGTSLNQELVQVREGCVTEHDVNTMPKINLIHDFVENVSIQQHPEDVGGRKMDDGLVQEDSTRRRSDTAALELQEAQQ